MKHTLFLVVFLMLGLQACKKETITPIEYGTVSDADGNSYKTVKIGDQWWMCENLRVKQFQDGSPITNVAIVGEDSVWSNSSAPAYCVLYDTLYGCYYNSFAVQDSRKLAPAGWHIPTDEEWKTLEKTIGMSESQSNQLAWRGTNEAELLLNNNGEGWQTGTVPFGIDTYDFSIFPAGCRLFSGETTSGYTAFFWTATATSNGQAYYRYFDYQKKNIFRQTTYPQYGMSIRCVKD